MRATAANRSLQLSLLGGAIFCALFYWSYADIPDRLYQVRDDGVITMSHARNWVDYGFIGVNPSGERVEGYSAPVQFFIYALAYRLSGVGYDAYAVAQTAVPLFCWERCLSFSSRAAGFMPSCYPTLCPSWSGTAPVWRTPLPIRFFWRQS